MTAHNNLSSHTAVDPGPAGTEADFYPRYAGTDGGRAYSGRASFYLSLSDLLALLAAILASAGLAIVISQGIFGRISDVTRDLDFSWRAGQLGILSVAVLMRLHNRGHYRNRLPFWTEVRDIVIAMAVIALIDGFLQYVTKAPLSRLWLVQNWLLATVLIISFRHVTKHALRALGKWDLPTILIGSGESAEDARRALESEPNLGYAVVKVLPLDQVAEMPGRDTWTTLCEAYDARFIVLAVDLIEMGQQQNLVASLARQSRPYAIIPTVMRGLPVLGMEPQYFFSHDLLMLVGRSNLSRPLARAVKRAFDIIVASVALVWVSPLFLAIVAAVKLDGGPVFFGQQRVGENGRMFKCLKFRTMVVNADRALADLLSRDATAASEWQRDFKIRKDPRITKVGGLLRRTSLDEIPQLINVIRGDMSLVGPRPIIPAEIERYGSDIEYYYGIKPGITGLWQVSGRNDVDYVRRVQLDAWYVKNWSLWHDIAILFKTLPAVLLRRGAY